MYAIEIVTFIEKHDNLLAIILKAETSPTQWIRSLCADV